MKAPDYAKVLEGLREMRALVAVPGVHLPSEVVQAACTWIDELAALDELAEAVAADRRDTEAA